MKKEIKKEEKNIAWTSNFVTHAHLNETDLNDIYKNVRLQINSRAGMYCSCPESDSGEGVRALSASDQRRNVTGFYKKLILMSLFLHTLNVSAV